MKIRLDKFWLLHDCLELKPCMKRVGAATFHPKTVKHIINNSNLNFYFLQPTYRPHDSNFDLNHKYQKHLQYQVLIHPFYGLPGHLCFKSLQKIGLTKKITMKKSHWENTTLNAWGLGWECLIDSIEVCQITVFHQICGLKAKHPMLEITYGLERLELVMINKRRLVNRLEIPDCYINTNLLECCNALVYYLKIKQQLRNHVNHNFYSNYFMFLKLIEIYNRISTSRKLKQPLTRCILNEIQDKIRIIVKVSQ
ncbi:Glycine--tRNA ligase alpha subunit [Candidatus Hodgkinia cicadicola]|uniref:Glycine--tRNA ligase alpha subunit n=1 Tax=Candidatus Hodgkinia cicadicola TaxID=573658 RepID=A0ABX4MGZ3_9HYPH|nr:Glycine--tRNA ligase alpha subunit [Candidatus Hodgkinia cicadicola]PIM96256.1 Glycine--tRNA ligase alpha subunit [Candidatus Hodgkinia cicadicola]